MFKLTLAMLKLVQSTAKISITDQFIYSGQNTKHCPNIKYHLKCHTSLWFSFILILLFVSLNVIRRISLLRYLYINVSYLTIYWSCHVRTSTGNEKLSCSHVTDISSLIQFVLAYVIIPHKRAQGLTLDSPPPHCPRLA